MSVKDRMYTVQSVFRLRQRLSVVRRGCILFMEMWSAASRQVHRAAARYVSRARVISSMKNPSVKGDQYVTVEISVPRRLTPRAKEALEEYRAVS